MKKNKINKVIEYLSLTLILSYFILHNIFLVLIGITFSFYLIHTNTNNNQNRSISKNLNIKKEYKEKSKHNNEINLNTINQKSIKEDTKLTLVEEIEELGFIPSIDKRNNTDAA